MSRGGQLDYEKQKKRNKVAKDKVKHDQGGLSSSRGNKILAMRLINTVFEKVKPLFTWTDTELYILGMTIRKEWRRRRNPTSYKEGHRARQLEKPGNHRHPTVTGEYLEFTFDKFGTRKK